MDNATPTHNTAAEQAVLGAVLLDNSVLGKLGLSPLDFYEEKHRVIYETMLRLVEDGTPSRLRHGV